MRNVLRLLGLLVFGLILMSLSAWAQAAALASPIVAAPAQQLGLAGWVIGGATAVFAILQLVKQAFPNLTGWYGIAFNFIFSAIFVVSHAGLGDVTTLNFWVTLLLTSLSASGINGKWNVIKQ